MFGKEWNSQLIVNFPVTNVPRGTGSNTKTLELKHLQFPDMGASGGRPDGARVVNHRTDELLIQHNSCSDGETTTPFYE